VAGTPGTLPTNWGATSIGLTREIVGTGTENGITYIDVRFSGTTTGQFGNIRFEPDNNVAASSGQSWAVSAYLRLVAGSFTNIASAGVVLYSFTSAPAFISSTQTTAAIGATLTRFSHVGTMPATTGFVQPAVFFTTTGASGQAVDFTLRIGLPQLELGAFATSVIPTTTTALTRAADVASVNTLTPWYNAVEGTLFAEFAVAGYAPSGAFPSIAGLSDNTGNNRVSLANTNTGANLYSYGEVNAGGVSQAGFYGASGSPFGVGSVRKSAIAYAANNFAFTVQGLAAQTDTSGTVPTVSGLKLAADATGSAFLLNGYLRRVVFYPRRLANAELQAITT
jgi:hypothetical protein